MAGYTLHSSLRGEDGQRQYDCGAQLPSTPQDHQLSGEGMCVCVYSDWDEHSYIPFSSTSQIKHTFFHLFINGFV